MIPSGYAQHDDYLWLEDVDGEKALEFVRAQNKATMEDLRKEKEFNAIYNKSLSIYNATDKIAYPTIYGSYVYNFWKDKDHIRGIWRRCLLTDYIQGKYSWETLIDIDKMSEKDNIKWVFKGVDGLYPKYHRFLVQLSKGGGDAVVIREFDADKKQFIENGFYIDEAKGGASYVDENTLIVSSNFGEGTMTTSGYPRQVKLWKRGTLLKDASMIYEGKTADVGSWGGIFRDGNQSYIIVYRAMTFFQSEVLVRDGEKMIPLNIPEDSSVKGVIKNQLLIHLKSDWKVNKSTYKSGSLVSLNFSELLKGKPMIKTVIEPDPFSSLSESFALTKNRVLVTLLTNVTSHMYTYTYYKDQWVKQKVKAPELGNINILSADEFSDRYFFTFENFITPTTLYTADAGKNTVKALKSLPAYFDAGKYEVKQFMATSKDGALIPYFMVSSKNLKYDSKNPTLINAYGGFEVSKTPVYASIYGTAWLDKGGVYVLANIRGGGEYGPKWHQAGLKEKRQHVFDDLYAVSEDVIEKKITSPRHLGIMGGSNGGLLVGVAFTQRPDLYQAVVCAVPLLDMQRYNKLLAGASWMGEYGNPDIPEEWEYIRKYSPYQNLKPGMKYPEVLFTTSTRDDRVHPGHARKMVAKMNDMGYKTYYYENTEGGHAGSSTNEQKATSDALIFSYLIKKLK